MELGVLARYFVHGILFSLLSLILFFLWFVAAMLLVMLGSIIGLLIGIALLFLIVGFINGVLGDFLWNIEPGEGFLSTLFHGLVLSVVLLVANLIFYAPTLVFPSLATQVVAFIITTPIDGAIGKGVASWFGSELGKAKEEATEISQVAPSGISYTQPAPKEVSEGLPVCPLCKNRTVWRAYYKYGLGVKGYNIMCGICHAEWENVPSKPEISPGLITPTPLHLAPTEDIFALRNIGENAWAKIFLNREITFTNWKSMIQKFCSNCRAPLAEGEESCPKCGTKYSIR